MTETHMRQHRKPICDNAENLAGAGTDVRRCSDALGPRKNLHMREIQATATNTKTAKRRLELLRPAQPAEGSQERFGEGAIQIIERHIVQPGAAPPGLSRSDQWRK
jgi:hypothetical protein